MCFEDLVDYYRLLYDSALLIPRELSVDDFK
jgi:hypothetical protein